MNSYKRISVPRGLVAGTLVALGLAWAPFVLLPGSGLTAPLVQSALYVGLLVLTARSPRLKVLSVRTIQRWTINPLMRACLAIGINPLGVAIVETRGRVSGAPRRTPVGNGRSGTDFWIIAEHGMRANYVRNIAADPLVRIRLRQGLRYHWVPGVATLRPDDDPLARQRRVVRWHPLRAFNAMNVRILGADLLSVHVKLHQENTDQPDTDPPHQDAAPPPSNPEAVPCRAR